MEHDDYVEEFVSEYNKAVRKIFTLTSIIRAYGKGQLPFDLKCPIKYLVRQRCILTDYVDILIIRAECEGIYIDKQEYWKIFRIKEII